MGGRPVKAASVVGLAAIGARFLRRYGTASGPLCDIFLREFRWNAMMQRQSDFLSWNTE